jgi:hypothetical protein
MIKDTFFEFWSYTVVIRAFHLEARAFCKRVVLAMPEARRLSGGEEWQEH